MSTTVLVVKYDIIRSVAHGSITNSFAALGAPFGHDVRIVKFVNTNDTDMVISTDGTNIHDIIPAGGFALYDITSDGVGQNFVFPINTQIYIKYLSSPSSGSFYVVALYGQGQ